MKQRKDRADVKEMIANGADEAALAEKVRCSFALSDVPPPPFRRPPGISGALFDQQRITGLRSAESGWKGLREADTSEGSKSKGRVPAACF